MGFAVPYCFAGRSFRVAQHIGPDCFGLVIAPLGQLSSPRNLKPLLNLPSVNFSAGLVAQCINFPATVKTACPSRYSARHLALETALVLQGLGLICPGTETHSCDCIAGHLGFAVVTVAT